MGMFKFSENWLEPTPYLSRLHSAGYAVTRVQGKYILYNLRTKTKSEVQRAEVLGEYDTQEELENMCKLLLPEGGQDG